MTFAFGHLTGAWLFGKMTEWFSRKKIPLSAWLYLLLGGIISDIDFLLDWTFKTEAHRTFTHSLIFLMVSCFLVYVVLFLLNKSKEAKLFSLMFGSGIVVHIVLDMLFSQGVPLFWPNLLHFSFQGLSYFDPATPSCLNGSYETIKHSLRLAVVDMALGTAWVFYFALRKRIKF
ncbi:MAG: metal-dependent hydrolase [Nanoarchaeota archaeon]